MSKEREMYGIKILSNDEYNEYKGTYEEQIEELQDRIQKAIEYISKHNCIATYEEYKPTEYEYCCSADLLDILKGGNKE